MVLFVSGEAEKAVIRKALENYLRDCPRGDTQTARVLYQRILVCILKQDLREKKAAPHKGNG
jgi:hypothetical protein